MNHLIILLMVVSLIFYGCKSSMKTPNPPMITNVSPPNGVFGETITIHGGNLESVDRVHFGSSTWVKPITVSENQITTTVPKITAGETEIWVHSPDGISEKISFEVMQPIAIITSVSPARAKRGETITISGENLDIITIVRFSNDSSSSAAFIHDGGSLKVIVPEDAVSGAIWISNPEGKSSSPQSFTVLIKPEIFALSSYYGVENKDIEITGRYFENATVYLDSIEAKILTNTERFIKIRCPKFDQVRDLRLIVTTVGGEAYGSFTGAPAPKISKAIPNGFIPGSALTLKGSNFFEVQSINLPDGQNISKEDFIASQDNQITIKLPGQLQNGHVTIENQFGNSLPIELQIITGGQGLNADNIASQVTNAGIVGGISRTCNPIVTKEFRIKYFQNIDVSSGTSFPDNPTFEGVFSGFVYSYCRCSEDCSESSECIESNFPLSPCPGSGYQLGDILNIGGRQFRSIFIDCNCKANNWRKDSGYSKFFGKILLELKDEYSSSVEDEEYTGFMIVEADLDAAHGTETYYGSQVKGGEYILESSNGTRDFLVIR